jgi:hypothetical protein
VRNRCDCGSPVRYRVCEVACIECGADCCPSCTLMFESTTYCRRCAASLLALNAVLDGSSRDEGAGN